MVHDREINNLSKIQSNSIHQKSSDRFVVGSHDNPVTLYVMRKAVLTNIKDFLCM